VNGQFRTFPLTGASKQSMLITLLLLSQLQLILLSCVMNELGGVTSSGHFSRLRINMQLKRDSENKWSLSSPLMFSHCYWPVINVRFLNFSTLCALHNDNMP